LAVTTKILDQPRIPGARRQVVAEVVLDSSYLEGGEPLTAAELGLKSVAWAFCLLLQGSESETVEVGWATYNAEKELLKLFNYKTQKEIGSTKNVEKVKVMVIAYGI
jgi:hypothetical protein